MVKSAILTVPLLVVCVLVPLPIKTFWPSHPVSRDEILKKNELQVMDILPKTYGSIDLNPLTKYLSTDKFAGPNSAVPFISLGHAYLNRYENNGTIEDFTKALEFFEFVASPAVYPNWGNVWASSPTAAHLICGIYRLKTKNIFDFNLAVRVNSLFGRGEEIAILEADQKLSDDYPYQPYISGTPEDGDSKAEENAWESSILAWASQVYPNNPHAYLWEAKGRELAAFSIVRSSDNLFFKGNQIVTVDEDFTLTNHWVRGNLYYEGGTILILRIGALAYHMTGNKIPIEYSHNVIGLYNKYKEGCSIDSNGRYYWSGLFSPVGSPTLFPLRGFDSFYYQSRIVSQKERDGYLWVPSTIQNPIVIDPEKGLVPDSSLGVLIQNSKVFWYYLNGAYLWH